MISPNIIKAQSENGEEEKPKLECSCVKTARYYGIDIPFGTNADKIKPNSMPVIGGGILFKYPKNYHLSVILQFLEYGFWTIEGNYKPCEISYRFISYNDKNIIGFITKNKIKN